MNPRKLNPKAIHSHLRKCLVSLSQAVEDNNLNSAQKITEDFLRIYSKYPIYKELDDCRQEYMLYFDLNDWLERKHIKQQADEHFEKIKKSKF